MQITLMMAITLDGKIGRSSDHLANWTSTEDKKLFAKISREKGVILMGYNTYKTFKKPLPERLNVVFTEETSLEPVEGVRFVSGEPEKVLEALEKEGYSAAVLGGGTMLNSLFLDKNLIDEIILTIEPKIFGTGLSLFNKELNANLELLEYNKLNDNTLNLRYRVLK